MKTLEQWQKELPDYEVWSDSRPCDHATELLRDGKWAVCNFIDGTLPYWDVNGVRLSPETLCKVGAIFRRKKERQREFKVEVDWFGGEAFDYKLSGDSTKTFMSFLTEQNIKSATLRVDEWGGE